MLYCHMYLDLTDVIVASVNESASVDEFVHVTKVHALTVWDLLAG